MLKKLLAFCGLASLLACNSNNAPDVSHIKVAIKIDRFEKAFFAIDTNHVWAGLIQLKKQFPHFSEEFTAHILGAGPIMENNETVVEASRRFISSYLPVNQALQQQYNKLDWLQRDLTSAFKYVKYYFPQYPVPPVITYVGPFDAPGVAITPTALAIGLQLYAGKDFSFYNSVQGQELYPSYISRRFEKAYMVPNCMKAVAEDLYADNSSNLPLIEQMVQKGKYWYMLNKLLPDTPDSLITGYTAKQLAWCKSNEGLIWNFMLQSNQLYTTDPSYTQLFIGEAPSTQVFPKESPGNIGQWVGWQIVQAYSEKHPDVTLQQLMQTAAKTIFQEAKYKPR